MALNQLASRLEKKIEELAKNNDKVKKVARAVLQSLVENTPVDTSKAISNYQVSLVAPKTSVKNAFFVGRGGTTKGESSAEVLRRGFRIINERKDGQAIYIVNNTDYIAKIDSDGIHTPFVKPAVLKGRRMAKK